MIPAASAFNQSVGQGWAELGDLTLAFVLASAIGFEREARQRSAGLRTHTLVGFGSALIMLVSEYGFTDVLQRRIVVLDPSRIAAQIVTAIGFIGGGLTAAGAVRAHAAAARVHRRPRRAAVRVRGLHRAGVHRQRPSRSSEDETTWRRGAASPPRSRGGVSARPERRVRRDDRPRSTRRDRPRRRPQRPSRRRRRQRRRSRRRVSCIFRTSHRANATRYGMVGPQRQDRVAAPLRDTLTASMIYAPFSERSVVERRELGRTELVVMP